MMATSYTIYGYDDNPRTRIIKIVAAAEGIQLRQSLVIPRKGINKVAYMESFPLSQGKIPALKGPGVKLTETIAIAYYLSRINPRSYLLGSARTLAQESSVLSYVAFANQELLPTLARWFLPLIHGFKDPAPYNHDAVEEGKQTSLALLKKLEGVLDGVEWLVGDSITLADIFVGVVLSRGLQWVLGTKWRETHPACMKHFERLRALDFVAQVVPDFKLVEEEPPNVQPPAVV